jgi:hypothetical protein
MEILNTTINVIAILIGVPGAVISFLALLEKRKREPPTKPPSLDAV